MIPFLALDRKCLRYKRPIQHAIARVLRRGWFILGPELRGFEAAFARYLNVKHVIGLNSGTDALFLALKALGIGPSDEVITVANTATPTISAIRMTGATPVFIDVLLSTQTLNSSLIERAITSRTKAIIPVHLFGHPAEMQETLHVARKHKLRVVEDACQSHGAKYGGQMVGTLGDAGCFSFYPTKNLGAFGDAGAVVTNNDLLAEKIRSMRNYGEVLKYENAMEGINSRLDELQAALLNWGLGHLNVWNAKRGNLANIYLNRLKDVPLKLPPGSDGNIERIWHLFVIRTKNRDALQSALRKSGIETLIHYPMPVYKQKAYHFLHYKASNLPNTARLSSQILSLPLHPELARHEVSEVCDAIVKFYNEM